MTTTERLDTRSKALAINLDRLIYGTFAEIGAGQEVAAWFFRVGGAAGTVAKTMSAYDMKFSDEIYGKSSRYVSRDRLTAMLDHEYELLLQRLGAVRGAETSFFVFADTISARNYYGTNECHGWVGLRFQSRPGAEPSEIAIHVNLTEKENVAQQQAIGVLGVNLVYAAFYLRNQPEDFFRSFLDDLSINRVEIDVIDIKGPDFAHIEGRSAGMQLLRGGLAHAIMFDSTGKLVQPSEALYKRPILIERGSFRAVHGLHEEMIGAARRRFSREIVASDREPLSVLEMTINNLLEKEALSDADILARVDKLNQLGYDVLVSTFPEYFYLTSYLRRYTAKPVGFVIGTSTLVQILNEEYYRSVEGGILEAVGRLLSYKVKMYVYPMPYESFCEHLKASRMDPSRWLADSKPEPVRPEDLQFGSPLEHLYKYLIETGVIVPLEG